VSCPVGLEATRLLEVLDAEGAGSVIHLAADEQRARDVAHCLAVLAPKREVLVFPPWDRLPYDTASPSAEAMGMRMSVLRRLAADRASNVVVTSPEAALQRVPPASVIRSFPLRSGQEFDAEVFRRFCQEAGYAIDDRVDEPGEVAIRGGVIDIFPGGRSRPVRLEFDGALLTAIRVYDPATQRTTESIPELEVDAVSELPPADDAESVRPPGAERRLPEACPELATLFDYLPDAALVEASDAAAARSTFLEQLREARDGYARSEPQPGSSGSDRLYLLQGDWQQLVSARRCRTLNCEAYEPAPRFLTQPRPRAAVTKFMKDQLGSGRRLILTAPSRRELARLLRRAGQERAAVRAETWREAVGTEAAGAAALEAPFDRGFVDAERSLAVITAHDLLGSRSDASGASEAATALWRAEAAELQLWDVVVHADRGVGRLEGIEPLAGPGACGDAIRIGYADDQDLLVPAAEAGKLWRYGSEDADVSLDRLTGDAWSKRRAKIAVGLAETARGLISAARQRRGRQAPKLAASPADYERFAARFPFRLTPDQRGAIEATLADLGAGVPMNRLIVGDVGFGKTEVALRAAAVAALAGAQVAVVAPTTVLARQHYETFRLRFAGFGIEVGHLSRLVPPSEARRVRAGLADGRIRIAVGTHALLGNAVGFSDLGLLVIDEEQRFGAQHKRAMRSIAADVHVLTMTATPIPRTLQGALLGLLDLSVIATPPLRRRPVRTLAAEYDRSSLRRMLMRERRRGGQSFVVVPRVEDIAAIKGELRTVVPELTLRVAHGQMPARGVDESMVGFAAGEGDVLLATSIIESGLDVPRANTMVVLGPDRFGLAQLHQLRGRVGRGHAQAYCYLMTEPGAEFSEAAMRRLGTLQAFDRLGSGMAIALHDLDLRGAGELFGESQAGHVRLLGPGLYQEMLAAALRAEKGEPPPVEVTLQLDAGGVIPDAYAPEPIVRINLYHRLARTRDLADVDGLADEIADRFGPLPPPLEALLQTARLRALAARLRVTRIAAGADGVAVVFEPGAGLAPEDIDALAPLGDAIDWNGERLLLSKRGLGLEQARDLAFDLLTELD
jgi:transcription-repair coupling factor (superfamily II helicase)